MLDSGCGRDWHQGLGHDIMGCAAVPKSGCWVKGPALTSLSLTAEMELLNQVSIPAHFVALNGDKLNINLKTGSEVRVSGSGCCWEGWDFSLPPLALAAFSL